MNKIFKLGLLVAGAVVFAGVVDASGKDRNKSSPNFRLKHQSCPMPSHIGNGNKNKNGNSNANGNKNGNTNGNTNTNKNVNDITISVNTGTGHNKNRNNNNNLNNNNNNNPFGQGNNGGLSGGTYSPNNSPTSTYSPSYSFGSPPSYGISGGTVGAALGGVPAPNAVFNEDDANTAWLTVEVPNEQAEVWLNGVKMPHQGLVRKYVSPPLDPKLLYNYDVKVQWPNQGVKQNHNTKITLKAGDEIYHVVPKEGVNVVPAPQASVPEDDEKVAATKLGFAKQLIEDKKMNSVKGRLEDIIKKYPKTKAAEEAKELLSKL